MIKEFIPYEQALALKELGFDEPYYFATYLDSSNLIPREEEDGWDLSKGIIAPLYQQAFRWFREKYNFISEIKNWTGADQNQWYYMIHHNNQLIPWRWVENKSYEEAELECLKKLIEVVKGGNNE